MTKEAGEAAKAQRKKVEASPTREDYVREFGADKVKDEPDGSWTCNVIEPRDIRKAYEMMNGVRQVEIERGREYKSRWDGKREKVVRRDGKVIEMPEHLVDQVKNKVRPAGRGGRGIALRFGMSDVTSRYVRGPDGIDFVWNDGWEPTELWVRGKNLPNTQRDPDGNVWVKKDGEWQPDFGQGE